MTDHYYPNPDLFDGWLKFRSACSPRTPIEEFDVRRLWDAHLRRQRAAQVEAAAAEAAAARARTKLQRFEERMRARRAAAERRRSEREARRAAKRPASPPPPPTTPRPPQTLPTCGINLTYDLAGARTRGEAYGDAMPVNAQRHVAYEPPTPKDLQRQL